MNTIIFEVYQDNSSVKWYAVVAVFQMLQANYLRQQIHQSLQFLPPDNIHFVVRKKVYAY